MFFGAEFFYYDLSFAGGGFGFFGESDLLIPDNLYDLGAPAIFGLGSNFEIENEPENCNYFSEIFYNLELHAELFSDFFRRNLFDSNYFENRNYFLENYQFSRFDSKKFARGFSDIFDFYGNYFYDNKELYRFSNGFIRDFEQFFVFCGGNYFVRSPALFFSQSYFEKLLRGFEFTRKISEFYNNSLKFTEYNSHEFEEINKFSAVFSEKSREKIDFIQSRFFDVYRGSVLMNSCLLNEKNDVIFEGSITKKAPENIYFAAAKSNYFEDEKPGTDVLESLSSGLNRRVDQLEKMIRSKKTTFGIDYDSVARQLELELRSALNSCCEGVHF